MKKNIIFIIFTVVLGQVTAQSDSLTVYKNLDTSKYYDVKLSAISINGGATYEANRKIISKTTYDKYDSLKKNRMNCAPCILETYDENDLLLQKSVSCTHCFVGWFEAYFPNGNLKVKGSYKENPTDDWEDIWKSEYCSVKHGKWTYFSEIGDSLYSEYWDNGSFIKQIPEQTELDIWDVKISLNNEIIDTQSVHIDSLNQLVIQPKYKNSNTDSDITIKLAIVASGYNPEQSEHTLASFKECSFTSMHLVKNTSSETKLFCVLIILSDDKALKTYVFDIER
jgi:hypothetical protein